MELSPPPRRRVGERAIEANVSDSLLSEMTDRSLRFACERWLGVHDLDMPP